MTKVFYYPSKVSTKLRKHITRNLNKQGVKASENIQHYHIDNTSNYHNYKVEILAYYSENEMIIQVESIIQKSYTDSIGVKYENKRIC